MKIDMYRGWGSRVERGPLCGAYIDLKTIISQAALEVNYSDRSSIFIDFHDNAVSIPLLKVYR